MPARPLRGFYAILDLKDDELEARGLPSGAEEGRASLALRARALLAGGPCMMQLRAKTLPGAAFLAAAQLLGAECRRAGVPFCVNDRLDVALAAGADALHLGQEDLPLEEARRLVARAGGAGRALLIGVSTHTPAQAEAAERAGADYIGFGPVFPTRTKANPDAVVGLEALARVSARSRLPVVAIGGITVARAAEIARAGAAAAALISEIEGASDPTAAALAVGAAFAPLVPEPVVKPSRPLT